MTVSLLADQRKIIFFNKIRYSGNVVLRVMCWLHYYEALKLLSISCFQGILATFNIKRSVWYHFSSLVQLWWPVEVPGVVLTVWCYDGFCWCPADRYDSLPGVLYTFNWVFLCLSFLSHSLQSWHEPWRGWWYEHLCILRCSHQCRRWGEWVSRV